MEALARPSSFRMPASAQCRGSSMADAALVGVRSPGSRRGLAEIATARVAPNAPGPGIVWGEWGMKRRTLARALWCPRATPGTRPLSAASLARLTRTGDGLQLLRPQPRPHPPLLQSMAMPVLPPDKRRIIQNFTDALIYSKPAEGHFGQDKVCMRQRVACATCAKVAWIDSCFPCYLFQDCPEALRPRTHNDADDSEFEEEAAEVATDDEAPATEQRRGRLLKEDNGYDVIDAHAINELLDVNKYIEAWPQIPTEELHASSVQHPSHPEYSWLLNTRRIPLQASSSDSAATEHGLPKCAGVGMKDQPFWLCKSCTTALCRHEPAMLQSMCLCA